MKAAKKKPAKPKPAMRLVRGFYVHPASVLMGDVTIGRRSSIWPGTVIRGDMNRIALGECVNIQDNCTLHVDSKAGLSIGDYSLVGHNCMIHSCTVGRACLIGIGSIILEGAVIGDGSMITAGVMLRGGTKIPPRSLVIAKGKDIEIYEGKARTLLTIAGSLEYEALAQRACKGIYGPFSPEEETQFVERAKVIQESIFSGGNA